MKNKPSHFPEFRKDLEIVPRAIDGRELRYLLKDPASEEIFEFGEEEWFLCRQMDGKTSLPDILSAFHRHTGIAFKIRQLEEFERRLNFLGLLSPAKDIENLKSVEHKEIRLGNPDKFLEFLNAGFGWCFSSPFLIFTFLIIFTGLSTCIRFNRELIFELNFVCAVYGSPDILLVIALGWLVVNPLGLLAQGMACKHYGGRIPEFNVVMAFRIFPRFYFDISDALWFMEKNIRTRILSAGLVFQLFLFSLYAVAWSNTAEGTGVNHFLLICMIATALFFFLNLLPFFERDGYLLLNERLEIFDLHNRAKRWIKSWFFLRPLPEPLSRREIVIFKRYGFITYAFEIGLWCFLLWQMGRSLTISLHGVGACIFSVFLLLRFEDTIRRVFIRIFSQRIITWAESGGVKLRFLFRFSLPVLFLCLMFVPYPFEAGGDIRLLPINEQGIRSQVSGEICIIHVREGQWVKEGQPVAQLVGRDQQKRVEEVQATIDMAEAKKKMFAGGAKPEEISRAEQEVKAAAKILEYGNSQADRAEKMFKNNALSEKEYENNLKQRDADREKLLLAKKDLELVRSGFRIEQVEAADAEIRLWKVELAHALKDLELITLVSPIEGRIITPRIEEKKGQYLHQGELFAVVEDARTLIAEIEVPEKEIGKIKIGARAKLRTWASPNTVVEARVSMVAPVAYEQSKGKIARAYSCQERLIEQDETLREKGKVIRVICELDNSRGFFKTGMTGYAKIETEKMPVAAAFSQWLMRFLFVEVWSWIP